MALLYPVVDYSPTSPWTLFGSGATDIQHSRLASGPSSPDDSTGMHLHDSVAVTAEGEGGGPDSIILKWGMSDPSVGIDTASEVRIGVRIASVAGSALGSSVFTLKLYQGETLLHSYADTVPTESSVNYYNYSQAILDPTDITDPDDLYLVFVRSGSVAGFPEPVDRQMRITEAWISYTEGSGGGGGARKRLLPLLGAG